MPAPASMMEGGGHIREVPDGVSLLEQEQRAQLEKEVSRSRIPRLVLRPQQKVSPASESPFSEEESREFNPPSSSAGSGRTISSNSFCSGTAESPPRPRCLRGTLCAPHGAAEASLASQPQHLCAGLLPSPHEQSRLPIKKGNH